LNGRGYVLVINKQNTPLTFNKRIKLPEQRRKQKQQTGLYRQPPKIVTGSNPLGGRHDDKGTDGRAVRKIAPSSRGNTSPKRISSVAKDAHEDERGVNQYQQNEKRQIVQEQES
jgi:hypothetical protein